MSQQPKLKKHFLVLAGGCSLLACIHASAQVGTPDMLERQTDEAFRQVQQQPQDLAAWSRYAKLLVQAGNYEGGIAALERLLLEPQASPDLQVDIAILYYRLGSYAMAESMLRGALTDNRLQGERRELAGALLADTLNRNQRNQLKGVVSLGLRHQSNPTYRSDSAEVLSAGVLVPVASANRPSADSDVSVGLRINHLYDLERQNSAAIVTNFGAYVVDYSGSSGQLAAGANKPYDLQLLDLNTGLQFKPLPGRVPGLTLRPHLILANIDAQGQPFLSNQGLGLDLSWRVDEKVLYEFTLDSQRRAFASRTDIVNADQQNGQLYGLRVRASYEVGAGQVIVGEYAVRRNRAERAIYDFDANELRATYSIAYASPLSKGNYWTTALWVSVLDRTFGEADAAVTASEARRDSEWRIGVNHTVPLAPLWSMVLSAEYASNQANLPNFRYQNSLLSGSVIRRF